MKDDGFWFLMMSIYFCAFAVLLMQMSSSMRDAAKHQESIVGVLEKIYEQGKAGAGCGD